MSEQFVDVRALAAKSRETLIAARTVQEQQFNAWKNALLTSCSKEHVLDKIPFDVSSLTTESLIPEWYVDHPNLEIANQQLAAANEKINIVNRIVDELNREGIRLHQEFLNLGKANA